MKLNHSSLKDLRFKQSSMNPLDKTKLSSEEVAEENVSRLELSICHEQLVKEKAKLKTLTEQFAFLTAKSNELERHIKTLTSIVSEKDALISRLWDDILKTKKKGFNNSEILQRIDLENEVSDEGVIGETSDSVGKNGLAALTPDFAFKRIQEIDEIKRIRLELTLSQDAYKVLNERLKEMTEKYSKLDVEAEEMKEKLKFHKENSVHLTQQILKINNDKETELIQALLNIDKLKKKVETLEIERNLAETHFLRLLNQSNEELAARQELVSRLKIDLGVLQQENQDLSSEIQEIVKILKKKDSDLRNLSLKLEESNFEVIKSRSSFKPDARFLLEENFELKKKLQELKQGLQKANSKDMQALVLDQHFRLDNSTLNYLVDIFGKDSRDLLQKVQDLIMSYKSKIKTLKLNNEKLLTELSTRPNESQIFYSTCNDGKNEKSSEQQNELKLEDHESVSKIDSIQNLKVLMEKHKIAKKREKAEKEQVKENLAHAILQISELTTQILEIKMKPDEEDFSAFLLAQAQVIESCLNNE